LLARPHGKKLFRALTSERNEASLKICIIILAADLLNV